MSKLPGSPRVKGVPICTNNRVPMDPVQSISVKSREQRSRKVSAPPIARREMSGLCTISESDVKGDCVCTLRHLLVSLRTCPLADDMASCSLDETPSLLFRFVNFSTRSPLHYDHSGGEGGQGERVTRR
jgi:hypothetical protein